MDIPKKVRAQKEWFHSGKTLPYTFRKQQLERLKKMLKTYEAEMYAALKKDLNKSEYEAFSTEIGILYSEVSDALKKLNRWMKPDKVKTPISHTGSKSYIYKEPYGVTLIISPWNYPLNLTIAPLVGAIAAGNCAVIKPSEFTPTVSKLLSIMIKETFDENYITVVEGERDVSEALLNEEFDYIFFTGSPQVGKIVMEKASKYLTPVTLELGGKSPCIIDKDAKLDLAAKRTAWGKFINAGQTCIAPDYLLVHEDVKTAFLEKLDKAIADLYGQDPLQNEEYTKIINGRHFNRLKDYMNDGRTAIGGKVDEVSQKIAPTVVEDITWDHPVMKDEIFGPVLPLLTFSNLDDVKEHILKAPKPLALYYFSENRRNQDWIIENIQYAGGCINDTIFHFANPYLPFGGVGTSGMGAYHGKASFDSFSHHKSVLKQTTAFDMAIRYPNSKRGLKIIKRIMK
ncbi:aldehyde dehydrogenase [Salirhabdus sp. Marseille-P4669]|uniref:aldehyde dehydrogenase n=1 Tax=Salirhabdus sp. Marseille-P4669 TaxID=2042310 RepID=UPI000C7B07A2|nr:aldehyde dehydrogenase [Salirhabdus sp. Marseille-P4669]